MIIAVLCIFAVACAAVGWWMVQSISNPIGMMTDAMQRLAQKDLSTVVPGVGRSDEIGGMAAATQVFKDALIIADPAAPRPDCRGTWPGCQGLRLERDRQRLTSTSGVNRPLKHKL
jgi:HAMP domain-containing protein